MSSPITHDIPLGNYVDLLPESHPARREYMRLVRGNRRLREALAATIPALVRAQETLYQCGADPSVRYACERAEEAARAIAFQHDPECNCAVCLPEKSPPGYGA